MSAGSPAVAAEHVVQSSAPPSALMAISVDSCFAARVGSDPRPKGDVSTQEVLNRFVAAAGGTLNLIADFGDGQLKIA